MLCHNLTSTRCNKTSTAQRCKGEQNLDHFPINNFSSFSLQFSEQWTQEPSVTITISNSHFEENNMVAVDISAKMVTNRTCTSATQVPTTPTHPACKQRSLNEISKVLIASMQEMEFSKSPEHSSQKNMFHKLTYLFASKSEMEEPGWQTAIHCTATTCCPYAFLNF